MADIFISYARLDRERIAPLKAALDGLGLDSFFDIDGLDGGDTFPDVLDREVKTAKVVLGCWTPAALQRDWVKAECAIAHEQRTLVPLEFDQLSALDVPAAFFRLQRVNLTTWRSESKHDGWLATVRAISRRLGRPEIYDRAMAAAALSASGKLSTDRSAIGMDSLWSDWSRLAPTNDKAGLEDLKARAEGTLVAQLAASRLKDLARPAAARFLTGSEALGLPPMRGWRLFRFIALRLGFLLIVVGGGAIFYTTTNQVVEMATSAADAASEVAAVAIAERDKVVEEMQALRESGAKGVYRFTLRNDFLKKDFVPGVNKLFAEIPRQSNVTEELKSAILGRSDLFATYEVNTPERMAGFLGQVAVETGFFRFDEENTNYSEQALIKTFRVYRNNPELAKEHARNPKLIANTVYGDRPDLGNIEPDDGWNFRGRGFLQVTGRYQYKKLSDLLGIDLTSNPDLMSDPEIALAAALILWSELGLNQYADEMDFASVSRGLNRGNPNSPSAAHHEDLRIEWTNRTLAALLNEVAVETQAD
ncbi:MAG: TIR domain-containing protein [Hyphomonas sp.]